MPIARNIYLIQRTHQEWHRDFDDWSAGTPTVDILDHKAFVSKSDAERYCVEAFELANTFAWNRQTKGNIPYSSTKDYCNYKFEVISVPLTRTIIEEHP